MHFATFLINDGHHAAVLRSSDGAYIDLTEAGLCASVLALIGRWGELRQKVQDEIVNPRAPVIPGAAKRLAPIPTPRRNIFCVGKNYREHAVEFGRSGFDGGAKGGDEVPEYPIIFSKMPSSVSAPGDPIPSAADPYGTVDYEGELAIIIGQGGKGIRAQDAMTHVFGYTILNDVTAREVQKRHKQWLLGKGPDGFCPMGPDIVTSDEVGDVQALELTTHVNGELRQRAKVGDLIFSIPVLIEIISRAITLMPGDIIATGTPAGVGIGFDPPRYLWAGDKVSVAITGLGILENPVV